MAEIKKIGIVGAGQMGCGIAQVCSLAGIDVVLNDVSRERLNAALAKIPVNMDKQIKRHEVTEAQRDQALTHISIAEDYKGLSDADLVIEAATENEEVKRKIFSELCKTLKPETILASNTSSISITRLASVTDRPEHFMGIHFMNPVPRMQLVELIRGIATENTIYEATKTLYEGVGSVEAIDTAMRLGANHPMGPLQLADFIGLDTVLSVMQVLHEGLADSKYRPCPLLVKYVEAGWLGRKVQRGFYDYRSGTPIATR